jgi:hypothetical protein
MKKDNQKKIIFVTILVILFITTIFLTIAYLNINRGNNNSNSSSRSSQISQTNSTNISQINSTSNLSSNVISVSDKSSISSSSQISQKEITALRRISNSNIKTQNNPNQFITSYEESDYFEVVYKSKKGVFYFKLFDGGSSAFFYKENDRDNEIEVFNRPYKYSFLASEIFINSKKQIIIPVKETNNIQLNYIFDYEKYLDGSSEFFYPEAN